MTDKILGTFLNRLLVTAILFAVVIINTNSFGAEGTGTIALVILGLTLLQVLNNFVGGSTLVYLVPQRSNFQLLSLSYIWMIISNIAGIILLGLLNLVPREYLLFLFALSVIYNIYFIHISIMQVWGYNFESATAYFICAHDPTHTKTVSGFADIVLIEPDCTNNGKRTYTVRENCSSKW